jgi:hypothetical protein
MWLQLMELITSHSACSNAAIAAKLSSVGGVAVCLCLATGAVGVENPSCIDLRWLGSFFALQVPTNIV